MSRVAALALLALAPLASPHQAHAAETFHTCAGFIDSVPTTLSTQGVWCLRHDLATAISSGAAITIAVNNVTIDCNGFKLGGLAGGSATTASGVTGSAVNTTVRNCNIRGFRRGINLTGATAALIQDNRLDQNTERAISVSGENAVIQRNQVNDTGAGPASISTVTGIYTSGTALVEDNIVQGVVASNAANVSVYGMDINGGVGSSVSGNIVRDLVANGTGQARGIYTSNGQKVFITGNRVAAVNAPGTGVRCNSSNGSLKDNVSWGFAEPYSSGCHDDGGNVAR